MTVTVLVRVCVAELVVVGVAEKDGSVFVFVSRADNVNPEIEAELDGSGEPDSDVVIVAEPESLLERMRVLESDSVAEWLGEKDEERVLSREGLIFDTVAVEERDCDSAAVAERVSVRVRAEVWLHAAETDAVCCVRDEVDEAELLVVGSSVDVGYDRDNVAVTVRVKRRERVFVWRAVFVALNEWVQTADTLEDVDNVAV